MQNGSNLEEKENRLQDRVILIINGLSESGRVLTKMLAQQGSNVVIVDSQHDSEIAQRIKSDVRAQGRGCLIVTPGQMVTDKQSFSQYAIEMISNTFGRLDAFVSYSAADSAKRDKNGHLEEGSTSLTLFDPEGLTKAALRYILTQANA